MPTLFSRRSHLSWRRTLVVCVCLFLCIFASCSDEEANDTALPTVAIIGLPDDGIVWDTVALTVEAVDNEGIRKVVVAVDGSVIVDTVVDQAKTSLNTQLNTLNLAEGEHTLIVTATDESGNEQSQTYIFTVRNILITIDAPTDLLDNGEKKGFVFLSDMNGDTIVARAYGNGDHFSLRAPEYNGRKFFLTEAYLDTRYNTLELRTFQVTRGTTWKSTPGHVDETIENAGTAWLDFINPLPDAKYEAKSDRDVVLFSGESQKTPLDLIGPKSRLYITRGEDYSHPTHYALTEPISIGSNNAAIDLGQINNEMVIKNVDLSGYEYYDTFVQVDGITTAEGQDDVYWLVYSNSEVNRQIEYRYPGSAFSDYLSRTVYFYRDYSGVTMVRGMPDFTPLNGSIEDMQVNGNKITGNVPGDIDYVDLYLINGNTYWHLYAESGPIDQVIPALPAIVQKQFTFEASYSWMQIRAMQRPDFEGYSGLLDFLRTSAVHGTFDLDFYGQSYKMLYQQIFDLSPGGRKRQQDINDYVLAKPISHRTRH